MRRLTSQGVWDAVDWLLDANNKTLPMLGAAGSVMEWAESVFGKLSFSLGVGIEVGAVGGVEHAVAISGLRHHCVAFSKSSTIAVGAYEELTGSVQASVSGGMPENGLGLAVDVSFSAAYGVSGEVTISLAPSFHRPTLTPDKSKNWRADAIFGGDVSRGLVVDYSFAGLGVSVGPGAPGGGASIGYTLSDTFLLPGIVK